jgi:ATP-dependent DNA helicase DinG
VIEVEVHYSLHNFLRSQAEAAWPHHLTMARLVARALRLERSALIQVGAGCGYQGRYRLSYLAPALLWQEPVILVATEKVQQRLLRVDIPPLQQWLQTKKAILIGDRWPHPDFRGLLITSPAAWLAAQWTGKGDFPPGIPTIIDQVDDLEDWARTQLTVSIHPSDWDELMLACPNQTEAIRDARVQLTKAVFQHPANPYECYLVSQPDQDILRGLYKRLGDKGTRGEGDKGDNYELPDVWKNFGQRSQTNDQLLWATITRSQGLFSLYCAPSEVASALSPIWSRQPIVLIGSALEQETDAPVYRQRMGLPELTCLKFSGDRHSEMIQLYLPDKLPLPNTPEFQAAFMQQVHALMSLNATALGLTVVLVGDMPLKSQVGATLAAEFGSRVQVEKTCLAENGILVSGWEFWRQHQDVLPAPGLLVIATLPLPSLENPLVAGRVAYYKRSGMDWFRLYLLPDALSKLQRAIAPVRNRQGVVALLDSRVLNRSYGSQVLAALSPLARSNYLDASLFSQSNNKESE